MKEAFQIKVDTLHVADRGLSPNVHQLSEDILAKRQVYYINIANVSPKDP